VLLPDSDFHALILKVHGRCCLSQLRFGENNMHSCEIMLKDMADSKRINSNIKLSKANNESASGMLQAQTRASRSLTGQVGTSGGPEVVKNNEELSFDVVDATIISSLFWPPFQVSILVSVYVVPTNVVYGV
jgi:anaphase-promoting complex subunit 2